MCFLLKKGSHPEEREPPSCLINQIKMGKSIFLVWHLSLIDDFTSYHTTVTWVRHGLCFTDRTFKNHILSSFPFLNLKDEGKNRQIYVVNICMLKLQLLVSFTDWLYYLSSVKLSFFFTFWSLGKLILFFRGSHTWSYSNSSGYLPRWFSSLEAVP